MTTDTLKKMTSNPGFDGKEVTDELGRKIVLRKPNILDRYQLMKALGADASNSGCTQMMIPTLYVAAIDGAPFITPRTQLEAEAGLLRLEDEGIVAVCKVINEFEEQREKELKDNIKK